MKFISDAEAARQLAEAVWRNGSLTKEARLLAAQILKRCPGSGRMLRDVQTGKQSWCGPCGIYMKPVEGFVTAPDHVMHGYAQWKEAK